MIIETRESLLHSFERRPPRRRHHTLDNATLDQFNFICVPLNLDEAPNNSLSSHYNLTSTSSNNFLNLKPIRLSSPTRRVRFKLDENDKNGDNDNNDEYIHSSDIVQFPKDYSIHRVEFQIPMHTDINPWLNIDCSSALSTLAKTRSLTSQKIDISYNNNNNNATYQQTIIPSINSPILSTIDCNKTQTQWYKDMYCQIHKLPENKKDVLLVKLPHTPSRYQEYYQNQDEQQNPYKPTYTFPEEFDGNLERMEDYMRKAALQNIDDDYRHISLSPVRTSTTAVKDHKVIPKRDTEKKLTRFDDQLSSPIMTGSSIERAKSSNDASPSSIMINSKPNTSYRTSSSIIDDEQKLIYKRILRGGDIPSVGLQKLSINNRDRPLILTNNCSLSPKLFAYYSIHWEQNQTNQSNNLIDSNMRFEINSCLYFQNTNDNELEQIRQDGCGYIITYPPHIYPTDNLQIYNFDRTKNFLLTSNDVYSDDKSVK
ncbi:unnamed protein product [Rotaria sordida]|uniref:Uncharacterized protein n=1 Tax=Rotaria sordida TaxID=392033 RepID=A0A815J3Z2_9BILA|nr:unnamed protein product [Rotaria sordida]